MKFGIGIIGATGYIGVPYRNEIREASDQARIVALCARRRGPLEEAAQQDGAVLATTDWREVVKHPDVHLVVVATPDALHHEAVMACAAEKKHLFCEKPIGANAREATEMWTAYRDTQLGHFVPFWSRYIPVFRRAKEIAKEGRLGDIKAIIYRWHNPRPAAMPFTWRDDASLSAAGSIADVGSHAYDTVRWILGEEAAEVLAHAEVVTRDKPHLGDVNLTEALDWGESHQAGDATRRREPTAFDYANIIWKFPSGCVGSLILSHAPVIRKGLAPELELHGTEASLAVDRSAHQLLLAASDQPGAEAPEDCPFDGFGNRFTQHVFPAIKQQSTGQPGEGPSLYDGWQAQKFTDAAVESARTGRWVRVESDSLKGLENRLPSKAGLAGGGNRRD